MVKLFKTKQEKVIIKTHISVQADDCQNTNLWWWISCICLIQFLPKLFLCALCSTFLWEQQLLHYLLELFLQMLDRGSLSFLSTTAIFTPFWFQTLVSNTPVSSLCHLALPFLSPLCCCHPPTPQWFLDSLKGDTFSWLYHSLRCL